MLSLNQFYTYFFDIQHSSFIQNCLSKIVVCPLLANLTTYMKITKNHKQQLAFVGTIVALALTFAPAMTFAAGNGHGDSDHDNNGNGNARGHEEALMHVTNPVAIAAITKTHKNGNHGDNDNDGDNDGDDNHGTTTPDTIAPVITLNGSSTVSLLVGGTYAELGAVAADNVDGTDPVIISGSVNTSLAGTYMIDYNAVDNAGNHATQVVRTVNVASTTPDTIPPVISNIAATSTASTTAMVTWNTNEIATSLIFYSTTTPVDINSTSTPFVFNPALATTHSLNLTGLIPNTLYHFVLQSADASNNISTTFESTFTTQSQ